MTSQPIRDQVEDRLLTPKNSAATHGKAGG